MSVLTTDVEIALNPAASLTEQMKETIAWLRYPPMPISEIARRSGVKRTVLQAYRSGQNTGMSVETLDALLAFRNSLEQSPSSEPHAEAAG